MMSLLGLGLSLLSPLGAFILHVVSSRFFRRQENPISVTVAASLGGAFLCALAASVIDRGHFLVFLFLALLSVHPYLNLFMLSQTARRIRLLVNIRLTRNEFTPYDAQQIVDARVGRLLQSRAIQVRGNRYYYRPSWLGILARVFHWHERLLFPKRNHFGVASKDFASQN